MNRVQINPVSCSGCGACYAVCNKNAVTMVEDEFGYIYPQINSTKCIDCGYCKRVCPFAEIEQRESIRCYAGVNINREQRMLSSSGGIFSAIATKFLKEQGLVCGASMTIRNGRADIRHIVIDSVDELPKLQGSKYVQSSLTSCFTELSGALKKGKKILFSGTPCQVSAVKKMFSKYSGQLYTIDLICHGVPSQSFFNEYLENKQEGKHKIKELMFRDKKRFGWGCIGTLELVDETGTEFSCPFSPEDSSYYKLFFECTIFRTSCYHCPYACSKRTGDLTIGDYWGIQKFSPELLRENGGLFIAYEGVSCILENTNQGSYLLDMSVDVMEKVEIPIEKILIMNEQLREPVSISKKRKKTLKIYQRGGYAAVEREYQKWLRKENVKRALKRKIPESVKRIIRAKLRH